MADLSLGGGLASAVLLRVETNDLAGAEAALQARAGDAGAPELRGWVLLARGEAAAARAAFQAAGPTVGGLSGEVAAAEAAGDAAEAARAAAALQSAFPRSPEAVIARQRGKPGTPPMVSAPTPRQFLPPAPDAATAVPPATPAQVEPAAATQAVALAPAAPVPPAPAGADPTVSTGPAAAVPGAPSAVSARAVSVQTGSFGMRENADDMVRELRKRGFQPVIRETTSGGRTLFRVLAVTRVDPREADDAAGRLRALGYASFVFTDGG
jgi:DedD protein